MRVCLCVEDSLLTAEFLSVNITIKAEEQQRKRKGRKTRMESRKEGRKGMQKAWSETEESLFACNYTHTHTHAHPHRTRVWQAWSDLTRL